MTMKLTLMIICGMVAAVSAKSWKPFFRRDYVFNPWDSSFYKVHLNSNPSVWEPTMALQACIKEDSTLYYPKSDEDIKAISSILEGIPQNISQILVGYHNGLHIKELTTIDGNTTPLALEEQSPELFEGSICVYLKVQSRSFSAEACTPENSISAFVCKREVEVDFLCPTIDRGYNYEKRTKKCYKFHNNPMSWSDAMQTCFVEGGTLLVTEDEEESRLIAGLPHDWNLNQFIYVGFRRFDGGNQYFTATGKELPEGFFIENSNNFYGDELQSCGAYLVKSNLYENAHYRTTTRPCDALYPFICELKALYH